MKIDLERIPIPDEDEAEERGWRVVVAAYAGYEPRPAARRRGRLIAIAAAAALLAALVAVAVSPAGSNIVHSVREAIGIKKAVPALTRLPSTGRLLVNSAEGPWIVQPDGSKRLLGNYTQASWSPHGLFVVATREHELLALDPHGSARWSLARPGLVSLPRWAPDGFRIAYLEGPKLRIVAGDGTGDRFFADGVAHIAPAWRPSLSHEHVVAFASSNGELELYAVDNNEPYARHQLPARPRQLLWSADGQRLVALSADTISIFDQNGKPLGSIHLARRSVAAAFAPHSHVLAVILTGVRSDVVSFDLDHRRGASQQIFGGQGRFSGLAWSPNGQWLLLAWPSADQWLFIRASGLQRIAAVSAISTQFNPGRARVSFPTLGEWCCQS